MMILASWRLWEKVDTSGDCWEWRGAIRNGYGCLKVNGRVVSAHRLMYEFQHGPIPKGLVVMHSCDNRLCVKYDHLSLGTYQDNSLDAIQKGRHYLVGHYKQVGEKTSRHKLTVVQVRQIRRLHATLGYGRIAEKFGVSKRAIAHIIKRETWQEVA